MTVDLDTERLSLKGVTLNDWIAYEPIFAAPATAEFSTVAKHPSDKCAQRFVRWMFELGQQSKGFGWMIRRRDTHVLIGCIRLNRIRAATSSTSVGYELAQEHWGQGFATEAVKSVVAHCHDSIGLNRVEAWTIDGNYASDRVLLRAGFQEEGFQREKIKIRDARRGVRLFARLANDPR